MKQRVSRRHVRINNAIKWHTIIKTQQGAMRNIGTICFVPVENIDLICNWKKIDIVQTYFVIIYLSE